MAIEDNLIRKRDGFNMSKKQDNQEQGFSEKWMKVVDKIAGFKDEADAASVEELKKIVVQSEYNAYNSAQEKASDIKLNSAKEIVKDLSMPYREAIKCQQAKIQYCLYLLEGKGDNTGLDTDE